MAEQFGNLWEYNLAKIVIVDVSDDYRLMQPPMPCDFYPVLQEIWLPRYAVQTGLARKSLVDGYLYDWHESPDYEGGAWYVGVVSEELLHLLPPGGHMGRPAAA